MAAQTINVCAVSRKQNK